MRWHPERRVAAFYLGAAAAWRVVGIPIAGAIALITLMADFLVWYSDSC